jgi:hypothetical protein
MIGQAPDWEGIAQERMRSWETEVRHRQLLAQVPRQRPRWRRWTGSGLMRVGGWLTRWGERMAENECGQGVSVVG